MRCSTLSTAQECIRYNKVIAKVNTSLRDVRKALKGEVVMTSELEQMGTSLFNNQVPEMWSKVAYPSLKPLASWVPDLLKRIEFIQQWYENGKPPAFWISGFYFPQAFITGVMQNNARKYSLPIDTISYGYDMRRETVDEVASSRRPSPSPSPDPEPRPRPSPSRSPSRSPSP